MEHDKGFHVRPFPQQPHRGGKKLLTTINSLQETLSADLPNFDLIKKLQGELHSEANQMNDDALIDRLRQISHLLDSFCDKPEKKALRAIIQHLLKMQVDLKHL